jgi:hypothetical protein
MKVLYTIKEYAKLKGLSEIGARNRISSNHIKTIKIDKITYIIYKDDRLDKAKQTIKNKNSQIRELKLKLSIQNDNNKYVLELERQNKKLEKRNNKLEKKVDKIQAKKDKLYENILGTLVNQNKQIQE